MRVTAAAVPVALVAAALVAAPARAQTVTAEGALGAGMFGSQPASSVDVAIDVTGDSWAVGLGGRLRWLAGDGFRRADWDEASELAGVVRYGLWRWQDRGRPDDRAVSLAVGELGGVVLGHGSIVDGYAGGLDVDHHHLGAEVRGVAGPLAGQLVVDDLVRPRIGGLRAALSPAEHVVLGAQLVTDLTAPDGTEVMAPPGMDVPRRLFAAAGVDGELGGEAGRVRGAVYADLIRLVGLGSGLHLGVRGDARLGSGGEGEGGETGEDRAGDGAARVGARLELRAGTSGYLPGWIGPLYLRDRRLMVDARGMAVGGERAVARAGGLGGVGGLGELWLRAPGLGSARVGYAIRRGVSDLLTVRLAAPGWRALQAGLWTAAELRGRSSEALAVGAELRVRFPRHLFATAEAARLYRDSGGGLRALWLAQVAVGAVVGEGGPGGE